MSRYSQGSQVEREVREDLYRQGAVLVMKAGGSKVIYPKWWHKSRLRPKVDLIALMPTVSLPQKLEPVLVQVKKKGKITKAEKEGLHKFFETYGCRYLLARKEKGKVVYAPGWPSAEAATSFRLLAQKLRQHLQPEGEL
jgi:Holliday junction resolvase